MARERSKEWDRPREESGRGRDKDYKRDRDRDRNFEREKERMREREKEHEREKEGERDRVRRDKDKDRTKDKGRYTERERERRRERERDLRDRELEVRELERSSKRARPRSPDSPLKNRRSTKDRSLDRDVQYARTTYQISSGRASSDVERNKGEVVQAGIDFAADLSAEEFQMMQAMGIPFGFDSTKGKYVEDASANASAIKVKTKRSARQYMNRRGGFNRPLPAERTNEKVLRD